MCKRREIDATVWSHLFQVKRTKMCSGRPTIRLVGKKNDMLTKEVSMILDCIEWWREHGANPY